MMFRKKCSCCKKTKDITEFHRDKRNKRDGRQSNCKECNNSYGKKWRDANPGYMAEMCKVWAEKKKEDLLL